MLAFIGIKMLLDPHDSTPRWFQVDIDTGVSLIVVGGILAAAMGLSILSTWRDKHRRPSGAN